MKVPKDKTKQTSRIYVCLLNRKVKVHRVELDHYVSRPTGKKLYLKEEKTRTFIHVLQYNS